MTRFHLKRPFEGWHWKRKRLRAWAASIVRPYPLRSITDRTGLRKLNIGAGARPLPGWVNQDLEPHPGIDIVGDARDLACLPDHEFDVVRASHVLEHFYLSDVPSLLGEWTRLLKPGGHLMVCVPDFRGFVQSYLDDPSIIDLSCAPAPIDWDQPVRDCGYLIKVFGGWYDRPDYPHMKHRMIYDRQSLTAMLREHGDIEEVREFDYRQEEPHLLNMVDDSTNFTSLNLVAQKAYACTAPLSAQPGSTLSPSPTKH